MNSAVYMYAHLRRVDEYYKKYRSVEFLTNINPSEYASAYMRVNDYMRNAAVELYNKMGNGFYTIPDFVLFVGEKYMKGEKRFNISDIYGGNIQQFVTEMSQDSLSDSKKYIASLIDGVRASKDSNFNLEKFVGKRINGGSYIADLYKKSAIPTVIILYLVEKNIMKTIGDEYHDNLIDIAKKMIILFNYYKGANLER
jgi:hypothetical protein